MLGTWTEHRASGISLGVITWRLELGMIGFGPDINMKFLADLEGPGLA